MTSHFRKIVIGSCAVGSGFIISSFFFGDSNIQINRVQAATPKNVLRAKRHLPTRDQQIESLQKECFDVLIIGGGATGSGCALDAVTRGLKTALVESDDFASGTSSRSTKLIHGGVRYLQKAIMHVDIEQYRMVKEALNERANMLQSAPHLTRPLPIMLPVYTWWQIPYYWFGIKMYDFVAGSKTVKTSYYLSKDDALELFPMLRGDKLCGAIVYYDGQQNDARMNLSIALTATRHGATVANHVTCTGLHKFLDKDGNERLCGAHLRDELTGQEWDVKAKCIINAAGPFTDSIRKMDDPFVKEICSPSSGVHIVLPGYYSPEQMGLLDPDTSDGRVIFFLPWERHTIAGTTDLPCKVTHNPKPTEDEIMFILEEVKNYLNPDVEVRRGDVLSAWSGIRPLVSDPNKKDTQSLARNHIIHISPNKLVTIAGGKWTTYRAMAEHTIDAAIEACNLKPVHKKCQTQGLLIEGAHGWTPTMYIRLVQDFGLERETAQHLSNAYGDRAFSVAKLAALTGKRWPIIGKKVHPEFPYIDAEIRYAVKEYACNTVDVIARRLRLAFLNVQACQEALPGIIEILAEELNWDEARKKSEYESASLFLQNEMGQMVNRASRDKLPINLSKEEIQMYIKRFHIIDSDNKGYVSINDIRRGFKEQNVEMSEEDIHSLMREVDSCPHGRLELSDFLQMMSAIKSGHVAYSRFARIAEMEEEHHERELLKKQISVERSGGGL